MPKPSDEPLESMVQPEYFRHGLHSAHTGRSAVPPATGSRATGKTETVQYRVIQPESPPADWRARYRVHLQRLCSRRLDVDPLFTEKYVCVAAQALANNAAPLAISALAQHDFLVVSPGVASFDGSASSWFAQQGLKRNVVATVPRSGWRRPTSDSRIWSRSYRPD
jgi:hypothetical protein